MERGQKGFSVIEALIIIIAVAAIGLVGWKIHSNRKAQRLSPTINSFNSTPGQSSNTWQNVGAAIPGKYADAFAVDLGNGKYRMYYSSEAEGNSTIPIYSSISSDGINWIQEAGTRKTMAAFPCVLKLPDNTWRMYFQSAGVIKSATSGDGLNWTDESGVRIDTLNSLGLTFDNVNDLAVSQMSDGTYLMVYSGLINQKYDAPNVPNSQINVFLWATSKDGLSWDKKGMAIDSRSATYKGWVEGPQLTKWDDGSIRLYYWGYEGIYYSTFSSGSFSNGNLTFTTRSGNGAPFTDNPLVDPTLLKVGTTWYMYYGQHTKGIYYATLK